MNDHKNTQSSISYNHWPYFAQISIILLRMICFINWENLIKICD